MLFQNLNEYFQNVEGTKFSASIGEKGGFLTFSNSGKGGEKKYFTMSLESIKITFQDILKNLSFFSPHMSYIEKEWRDLGGRYFSDEVAHAMSTVQTKALFSTLSKIISWANDCDSETDQNIDLEKDKIERTLRKLTELIDEFTPQNFEVRQPKEIGIRQGDFDLSSFKTALSTAHLKIPSTLPARFVAALQTKPFVILTGLAGSGKTKLAEAFSMWISESEEQYALVSVGADWTNREPLLGFPDALNPGQYVKPDCGALDLILRAIQNPAKPYFLILDEMNMSHVERYFADFLSAMESAEGKISLHPDSQEWEEKNSDIPATFKIPKNLFVIGTVNIDETTYMFSPKVLDRANVIEFRVSQAEMEDYFSMPKELDMEGLVSGGAGMGVSFVEQAREKGKVKENLGEKLMPFFKELQNAGAEFGYRSAAEISRFVAVCEDLNDDDLKAENDMVDAAILQKLLPKVHGSRNKIKDILTTMGQLCLNDPAKTAFGDTVLDEDQRYPLSYEKLSRMHQRVLADGFTSFAEA